MKNILIGVDIGTSCTKAAITDKDGKILGQASQKYSLLVKQFGWAEQDPKDWEEAVYFTINQAVKTAGISGEQVAGICISGLFAGSGVLVDNKGNPMGNAIIWMDRRAVEESHETEHIISSHKLFEISGNRNDPYFGFNKILWIKKHRPRQWQNIRWLLSSNGYIVYCLTGNITMDCTSASNIGGIYDQRIGRWSKEVMEKLGIPESLFPEKLMKPEETAGFLTKEAAKKTGLKQGIPVCAGCTDCLASVIASGVVKENVQTAVIGTSINWGIIHRNIPDDSRLVTMTNAVCPEKWKYTYGGITCAGILNSWFLKTLAPYTKKEDYVCPTDFSVLEQEARKVPPGSHGLLVLPYFMGERSPVWDSEAKGIFCGLSVNHSRGHMYRAILESLAYAVRHIRETSRIFENASDICIASGGACSCSLWMQILADVLGITIITVSEQAQAPVGDCIIAGVSSGIIPSFDWAEKWCIYEKRYEPNKKNTNFYEPFYEEYKNLYESTSSILHRLSNLSHETASKS